MSRVKTKLDHQTASDPRGATDEQLEAALALIEQQIKPLSQAAFGIRIEQLCRQVEAQAPGAVRVIFDSDEWDNGFFFETEGVALVPTPEQAEHLQEILVTVDDLLMGDINPEFAIGRDDYLTVDLIHRTLTQNGGA